MTQGGGVRGRVGGLNFPSFLASRRSPRRHRERSEAIQFTLRHSGMRRKAQARNPFLQALFRRHGFRVRSFHSRPGMTALIGHALTFPRRDPRPSHARSCPSKTKGAGNAGCLSQHPRPHAQKKKHMSFSHHRFCPVTGIPCARENKYPYGFVENRVECLSH